MSRFVVPLRTVDSQARYSSRRFYPLRSLSLSSRSRAAGLARFLHTINREINDAFGETNERMSTKQSYPVQLENVLLALRIKELKNN